AVVVGHALQPLLRPQAGADPLQPVPRPARVRRSAGLGRALRERAPPELLRHDAEPERDGRHARAADVAREDRDPRQRAAAAREPAAHRRRDRHARRGLGRPRDLRLRARHQRGVLLDRRQSDALARALLRGGRADSEGVDGAGRGARAAEIAKKNTMWVLNTGLRMHPPFWRPPGYMTEASLRRILQNPPPLASDLTFEQADREGYIVYGSPATVRDKLKVFSDELKAGIVCSGMNGGSHEAT